MKYLETLSIFASERKKEDLEILCKEYLAYLIDDGYEILVKKLHSGIYPFISTYYTIDIYNNKVVIDDIKGLFKWNDIKYDFIQFFEVLTNIYKIKDNITIYYSYDSDDVYNIGEQDYSKEQILNDDVKDSNIYRIKIKIK